MSRIDPAYLVGLDIDGTIVTHEGELLAPVRAAVQRTVSAGHHVVIATGRSVLGALPVLGALGLDHGCGVFHPARPSGE